MDRYPYATPPRWWSPRPSLAWMRLWRPYRKWEQRRTYRLDGISVRGLELVVEAMRLGHGVLITPNHAGHADSHLLYAALERLPLAPHVMTAWQVFALLPWHQRDIYRRHGCFSVYREGNDLTAFRHSVRVLEKSSAPLVIFPEGEVYHLNDLVTEFRDGTLAIATAAVRRSKRPVACFPCGLKYFYTTDPAPELAVVMDRLEEAVALARSPHLPLASRLGQFWPAAIARREREFFGEARQGDVEPRIAELTEAVLRRAEENLSLHPKGLSLPERVKAIRKAAIERNERRLGPHTARQWMALGRRDTELEGAFRAVQLYSYRPGYLGERPPIERIAETIDKLEEDFLGVRTANIRGRRRGVIAFGEPVMLADPSHRDQGRRLSIELQQRVQDVVDAIKN